MHSCYNPSNIARTNGTKINGINNIGFNTIGAPKIIGSFYLIININTKAIKEKRPVTNQNFLHNPSFLSMKYWE